MINYFNKDTRVGDLVHVVDDAPIGTIISWGKREIYLRTTNKLPWVRADLNSSGAGEGYMVRYVPESLKPVYKAGQIIGPKDIPELPIGTLFRWGSTYVAAMIGLDNVAHSIPSPEWSSRGSYSHIIHPTWAFHTIKLLYVPEGN